MYEVKQHVSTTTPTIDFPIRPEDQSDLQPGIWVTRTGRISSGAHDVAYPNWLKKGRSDVQAIGHVAAVFGPHLAETDMIVQSETYNEGDDLTIASGGDKGKLTPAGSNDPVVASVAQTKQDLGSADSIEIEVD